MEIQLAKHLHCSKIFEYQWSSDPPRVSSSHQRIQKHLKKMNLLHWSVSKMTVSWARLAIQSLPLVKSEDICEDKRVQHPQSGKPSLKSLKWLHRSASVSLSNSLSALSLREYWWAERSTDTQLNTMFCKLLEITYSIKYNPGLARLPSLGT